MWFQKKSSLPSAAEALPGRQSKMPISNRHFLSGQPLQGDWPGCETIYFGMGCFWGAERKFWSLAGVRTTAVGYAGGQTPNPTYHEVCSGMTGHNEVVMVVYDPIKTSLDSLLRVFWESHDPTQGMRQGNDSGTQYRSGIYCTSDHQLATALASKQHYGQALLNAGKSAPITTEITALNAFYFAEEDHQQYLAKNPGGYCGLGGTGVSCNLPPLSA